MYSSYRKVEVKALNKRAKLNNYTGSMNNLNLYRIIKSGFSDTRMDNRMLIDHNLKNFLRREFTTELMQKIGRGIIGGAY